MRLAGGVLFIPLSFAAIALVNSLIQFAGSVAILWLARACKLSKTVGVAAAACYFLLPFNILNIAIPHKEGLVAALAMACAAAAFERRPLLLGFLAGLLALAHPGLALFPAFFAAFMPRQKWPLVALAGAAVLMPWLIRNWFVLGAFVPVTSSSGYSFWLSVFGNGNEWIPLPDHIVGNELEISRTTGSEARQWVSANPGAYLAKCLLKTWRAFALQPLTFLLLVAPLVRGRISLAAGLGLAHVFLVQMWFELGARHLFFLVPLALLTGLALAHQWSLNLAARRAAAAP